MTQPPSPRVSVIIPTYNRAALLPRAVNSVLAQTFADYEIIIVDDCSKDETQGVVSEFAHPHVRYVKHDGNRGVSAARNTGIGEAKGEYIAFLDDDDEWLPAKLKEQVRALDAAPSDVGMVYVWAEYVDGDGEAVRWLRNTAEGDVFEEALALRLDFNMGSTAMFRAEAMDAVGGFDEAINQSEDLDYIVGFTMRWRVLPVPRTLTRFHIGHARLSSPSRATLIGRRDHIARHLIKFGRELDARPRTRGVIWRRLAAAELRIGRYGAAGSAILRAFANDPLAAYHVARWLCRGALRRFGFRVR